MSIKPIANFQLIYVRDMERSKAFYSDLLEAQPSFESPRYVAYAVDVQAFFCTLDWWRYAVGSRAALSRDRHDAAKRRCRGSTF